MSRRGCGEAVRTDVKEEADASDNEEGEGEATARVTDMSHLAFRVKTKLDRRADVVVEKPALLMSLTSIQTGECFPTARYESSRQHQ